MEISAEVQHGIDLLNRTIPEWREKINPDSLDMSDCFKCVLGQLFMDEYNERLASALENHESRTIPTPYTLASWFFADKENGEGENWYGEFFGFEMCRLDYNELRDEWLFVLTGKEPRNA